MLKAGVIGAGAMGAHHARNLASLPDVRLVAVADPDLPRASALAAELGVLATPDPADLLGALDLVVIASPASAHARLARSFLLAGVHALVEKPLATTLSDGLELLALARARGLVLQGGHLLRFHGAVDALLRRRARPHAILTRRLGKARRISDVGVTLDLLVHDLDLTLLLLDEEVEEPVSVRARGHGRPGHEDHVEAELLFPSGARAHLVASRQSEHAERTLELRGPDLRQRLDFADYPDENPLRAQLQHMVACVHGAPPRFTPEQDLRALALALRVREQIDGRPEDRSPWVEAELPAGR